MSNEHREASDHVPFVAGVHYKPAYYRPVRENPRIHPSADADDVIWSFGVDCPRVAEAVRKLLRAGRKPGESRAKELAKACEAIQRELSFMAMEDSSSSAPMSAPMRAAIEDMKAYNERVREAHFGGERELDESSEALRRGRGDR